jgi:PRTRC genetic system protein E
MFTALAGIVGDNEEITVKITAPGKDGRMKVLVMPKAVKGSNLALAQPLALVATPQELDAGFITTLQEFGATRTGLAEQIAVTTTIMEAAKQTEAKKATKALQSKGSAPRASAQASGDDDGAGGDGSSGDEGNGNDFLDQGGDTGATAPATPPTPQAPAAANTNDDLLALF